MKNIKILIPKGKLYQKVIDLVKNAGLEINFDGRNYNTSSEEQNIEAKLMKAQNIVSAISNGSYDIGFTGLDWIEELNGDVVKLLDTKFDKVKVVVAGKKESKLDKANTITTVASEYPNLTKKYFQSKKLKINFIKSYGATEVFCPDSAKFIIDNVSTGKTLKTNNLSIKDIIMTSSTLCIASKEAYANPEKREIIDKIIMMFQSVLNGYEKVLVEMNVSKQNLEKIINLIPAMKQPTISNLYNSNDFAIKAAVPKKSLYQLLPKLKELGATDILEYSINRVLL